MREDSSVRYASQASNAMACAGSVRFMKFQEVQALRQLRLKAAVDHLCKGNENAFGRLLGYQDGAFVRQMLGGTKSITEKTVAKIEALPGMEHWFASVPSGESARAARNTVPTPFATHPQRPGTIALVSAVLRLREALEGASPADRESAAAMLQALARDPSDERKVEILCNILKPHSARTRSASGE